ncbi:boophilin-H2 [Brienomyrus brachyistius]|uniref:boophilin-H2 n=1 Tax=Brienomyrus brachyistius TaxID=42636 RepID=UPI0020B42E55|nr:boophilin-H2 [Brienomyrus brachyistius]
MTFHHSLGLCFVVLMAAPASSIDQSICNQPKDEGSGEELIHSLYYDSTKGVCVPFHYKGAGGNENRFTSDAECMQACSDKHHELYPPGGLVCTLKEVQGHCFAREVRFYYNAEKKACRTFMYGGCGGNGNNFQTKQECQETCAKSGRSFESSAQDSNPDASANVGLIVGIVGGCVFAVAVISAIVVLVMQRNGKPKDRKKVPTNAIEVEMQ